jgi:hypothetical protein
MSEQLRDEFGWVCDQGHTDCADTQDGPCLHDEHYGPAYQQAVIRRLTGTLHEPDLWAPR